MLRASSWLCTRTAACMPPYAWYFVRLLVRYSNHYWYCRSHCSRSLRSRFRRSAVHELARKPSTVRPAHRRCLLHIRLHHAV